jgi:hypothetical protein
LVAATLICSIAFLNHLPAALLALLQKASASFSAEATSSLSGLIFPCLLFKKAEIRPYLLQYEGP